MKTTAAVAAGLAVASNLHVGGGVLKQASADSGSLVSAPETVSALVTSMGARLVYVANGRVIRESPIPVPPGAAYPAMIAPNGQKYSPVTHTFTGPSAIAYRDYAYATNRVQYPMMRADWVPGGNAPTTTRGAGNWVRITWAQAYSYIVSEFNRIYSTYGPGSVALHESANSESVGVQGKTCYERLFNIMCSSGYVNVNEPTYSDAGWNYGGPFIYGYKSAKGICASTDGFYDTLYNSDSCLIWGLNPIVTGGTPTKGEEAALALFLKAAGKRVIVVDPKYSETAQLVADTFIPIIPGTDCAMAAAIAYQWIKDGTYNKSWVKTHVVGFDSTTLPTGAPANSSFSDYILGTGYDKTPKTPQWASAICGVPARKIIALARDWASHTMQICALAAQPQRTSWGYEFPRMITALSGMQGFGKPGAQLSSFPGSLPAAGNQYSSPSVGIDTNMNKAWNTYSDSKGCYYLNRQLFTQFFQNGTATWIGNDVSGNASAAFQTFAIPPTGYSMVHFWFCDESSHLSARVNANITPAGYWSKNMQFCVVCTPWLGGIEQYADIVLPICTPLEQVDVGSSSGTYAFITYHGQIIQPLFQSQSDFDTCNGLAAAFGVQGTWNDTGQSIDGYLELGYNKCSLAKVMTWSQFKAAGYVYNPSSYTSNYVSSGPGMTWYYIQPTGSGLTTPTGQLEIFSTLIYQNLGLTNTDVLPVPIYRPRIEGRYAPLAQTYPLELQTPHTRWRFHGQYDTIDILKDIYKITGPDGIQHEPVVMSSADAAARGISDGDIVQVFNARGAVLCGARVTSSILPGVVQINQASWVKFQNPMSPVLVLNGSANVLTSNRGQSAGGTWNRCDPDCTALVEIQLYTGSA